MRVAKPFSLESCWSLAIMESTGPLSPAACVCTRATRPAAACASNGARPAASPIAAAPALVLRKPRRESSLAALVDGSKDLVKDLVRDLVIVLTLGYGAPCIGLRRKAGRIRTAAISMNPQHEGAEQTSRPGAQKIPASGIQVPDQVRRLRSRAGLRRTAHAAPTASRPAD